MLMHLLLHLSTYCLLCSGGPKRWGKWDQVEPHTHLTKAHQVCISVLLKGPPAPALLWLGCYCYPYFVDEKTSTDRLIELTKATGLGWNKNLSVTPKPTLLTPQCYTFHSWPFLSSFPQYWNIQDSECSLWTKVISIIWEMLEMQILGSHSDLLYRSRVILVSPNNFLEFSFLAPSLFRIEKLQVPMSVMGINTSVCCHLVVRSSNPARICSSPWNKWENAGKEGCARYSIFPAMCFEWPVQNSKIY